MANDNDVRRLMEHILPNFQSCLVAKPTEVVIPDSFVPKGQITNELFSFLKIVLSTKLLIVEKRWEKFCAISMLKSLSSHEMYFRYVMFACDIEIVLADNIFDMFLKICALIITFIKETLAVTEVNFSNFAVDIFMVFYRHAIKVKFGSQGGFKRFYTYLRKDYNTWKSYFRDDIPFEERTSFLNNVFEELNERNFDDPYKPENNRHNDVLKNNRSLGLARKILLSTKMKLPHLPHSDELKTRIRADREKRAERLRERKNVSEDNVKRETPADHLKPPTSTDHSKCKIPANDLKCETPLDDLKSERPPEDLKSERPPEDLKRETPPDDVKRETPPDDVKSETPPDDVKSETTADDVKSETTPDDLKRKNERRILDPCSKLNVNDMIKQTANIIQSVVKYNNAKLSDPLAGNSQFYQEADKILEQLKNKINSLIVVLDKYDKEINV